MVASAFNVLADVDWDHMDDGWGFVMMFGMLLFWIAVIVLIVWLVRGGHLGGDGGSRTPTALEILDRRFAEGSISADEYRERRDTLQGHG